MVVTEGNSANPTTIRTKQQRGAAFILSYGEKKAAMYMALEWLLPSHAAAAICTGKYTLLWIPGRHGIAGNEEADACAKQAAAITDSAP